MAPFSNQCSCLSVCVCMDLHLHTCSSVFVYVQRPGLVYALWKVFRRGGGGGQLDAISPESRSPIPMFYWIWALKPSVIPLGIQCHGAQMAFVKYWIVSSISHARSSFPLPIWDKILEMIPLFCRVPVLNGSYFSSFICQSAWRVSLQRWLHVRL